MAETIEDVKQLQAQVDELTHRAEFAEARLADQREVSDTWRRESQVHEAALYQNLPVALVNKFADPYNAHLLREYVDAQRDKAALTTGVSIVLLVLLLVGISLLF